MKLRVILLVSVLSFLMGYFVMHLSLSSADSAVSFNNGNIPPTDTIVLTSRGNIYKLDQNNTEQITHGQNLTEPAAIEGGFVAIEKATNYSSLVMFDKLGKKIRTLFNGDTGNLDTMNWAGDPNVSPDDQKIAYVSDKDRLETDVPDNALYILNLADGKSTNVAEPDPYSGGLAHPVFNPTDGNIVLYDYYQYDPATQAPYSTIEKFDKRTGLVTTLTFKNKNAYQSAFSPDGKKLVFLGRNDTLNNVTLYLADFTDKGLANIQALAVGDFAYPAFSLSSGHIYYLEARKNSGYNLLTAEVANGQLLDVKTVVGGYQLQGNSSFSLIKK